MLKFIKSLFAHEEKIQEKISFNELNGWLDKKSKQVFDNLKNEITHVINETNREKGKAFENMKKLENASLQNPNIPNRAKLIMQGNREAFIKKTTQFLNSLDLNYQYFDELVDKCNELEADVTSLAKSTARSYMILNEFFARELGPIAHNIKKADDLLKKIKKFIEDKKVGQILGLKNFVLDINYKINLKESMLKDLEGKKALISEKSNSSDNLRNKIDKLKGSPEYMNYEQLLEQKGQFGMELKALDSKIFHDFSIIEKALKKYAKMAFDKEELIYSYIENPIKALEQDDKLEIIEILGKLKEIIEQNKLDIDGRKNEKITLRINEMDKNYFINIKNSNKKIIVQLEKIEHHLDNNKAKKEHDYCNKELENLEDGIDIINEDMNNLDREIGKISIEALKENLTKEIKDILNEDVAIL